MPDPSVCTHCGLLVMATVDGLSHAGSDEHCRDSDHLIVPHFDVCTDPHCQARVL